MNRPIVTPKSESVPTRIEVEARHIDAPEEVHSHISTRFEPAGMEEVLSVTTVLTPLRSGSPVSSPAIGIAVRTPSHWMVLSPPPVQRIRAIRSLSNRPRSRRNRCPVRPT